MIDFKNLFKKEDSKSLLKVDIHSHLIPSIDDGAKNIEKSIELIRSLKDLGYEKLITTPHIKQDSYPNTSSSIQIAYENLKKILIEKSIDINIDFAAEYYADENFLKLLKNKDILTFGNNYLMFEFSHIYKPLNFIEIIYEIQESGYKPVLAHPERYIFFHNNFNIYHELKDREVLFQVNLNSTVGYYSKSVQKIAKKLCDKGLVDFFGSDTHHSKHINALQRVINTKYYKSILKNNDIINDTL